MNLRQVLAIARYEMLMAFRRRTLVILGVLMLIGIAVFTQISLDANQSLNTVARVEGSVITTTDEAGEETLLPQALPEWLEGVDLEVWMGGAIVVTTLITSMIVVAITLVMLANETVPLDGQYRTHELLRSLPLSRASYLAGKVLGVWFSLLLVAGIGIVVSAIWFRVNFTYDFRYFLLLWGALVIPVLFVCGALSVLLTSWLYSRRIAILISLLVLPIALLAVVAGITTLSGIGIYLDPSYAYYAYVPPDQRSTDAVTMLIATTTVQYAAVLIAAWTFAWAWQRFREAR